MSILSRFTASARPRLLVFHIGDHKTGSTAIQYAFGRNAVNLHSGKASYPARLHHNYLRAHCDSFTAKGTEEARTKATKSLDELATRVRKSGPGICLISGESLEGLEPQILAQVIDQHFRNSADEIRIVAYVRPHLQRFLSNFAEQVKIGNFNGHMRAYHKKTQKNGRFNYHPRFALWREVFGDQFILRPFIRDHLYQGDVVHDLLHHGFGERAFQITGPAPANESLSLQDLMRLKLLQSHMQQHPQALCHTLGWEFSRLVGTLPPAQTVSKLTLPRPLAKTLHQIYLEDARAMDQMFFSDHPLLEQALDQDLAKAAEVAQSMNPADHLSASEIRSLTLMGSLLADMLKNKKANWVQHFRKKRIEALRT